MICLRHQQPNLWETFFGDELADLWEPWMRAVDELLEDDVISGCGIQGTRKTAFPQPNAGRHQTPSEVVLRMLILKHVRNWSYETLEREVRANVVYRCFCRIGMEKVPDAKALVRLGQSGTGNDPRVA
jgi:IS5 family transposase